MRVKNLSFISQAQSTWKLRVVPETYLPLVPQDEYQQYHTNARVLPLSDRRISCRVLRDIRPRIQNQIKLCVAVPLTGISDVAVPLTVCSLNIQNLM